MCSYEDKCNEQAIYMMKLQVLLKSRIMKVWSLRNRVRTAGQSEQYVLESAHWLGSALGIGWTMSLSE